MALDQSALLGLLEMLRSADDGELMRRLLGTIMQELVEAEATAHIGAGPHERTETRTTQRNGTRETTVTTTAGDLTGKIPKVRTGSFFPALLAPRRRIDVALHAVVMQAYVEGVSTRRVDDLVVALGGTGISNSGLRVLGGDRERPLAPVAAHDAGRAHQPGDPLAPDLHALVGELGVDLRAAVELDVRLEDRLDPGGQHLIAPAPGPRPA